MGAESRKRKRLFWRWGSPRQDEGARVIRMADAARRLREERRPEPTPPAAPGMRRAS